MLTSMTKDRSRIPVDDIAYCYACLQYHIEGEHRWFLKFPYKSIAWTVKILWRVGYAIGMFCGGVVALGWAVLLLAFVFFMFLALIGIRIR
jgi:hypothetical protein